MQRAQRGARSAPLPVAVADLGVLEPATDTATHITHRASACVARSYVNEARVATKSALDAQATHQQDSRQRERQADQAADQMVLQQARLQEQQIQRQQLLRLEHQRETAAYNLRVVQEQRAEREHQKAASRRQAEALEERSFFDRFGTSLA